MNLHPCFMHYCAVWVKFVVGNEHNAAEHCELGKIDNGIGSTSTCIH